MFINPRTAIKEGWVTGIHNEEKQVQPNAIDFTLDKVYSISAQDEFIVSEYGKVMRNRRELHSIKDRRWEMIKHEEIAFWVLQEGVYDCMSDVSVTVPEDVAAMLIIRSTFNRNGIYLTSGLYDSGYQGHIGFALHVRMHGNTKVAVGTRVGQLIFVKAGSATMYDGNWNHSQGTHYAEEKH